MGASLVVIGADVFDIAMKIDRIPEERVVEIFAPDGPDQSFHEWVRHRDIGWPASTISFSVSVLKISGVP